MQGQEIVKQDDDFIRGLPKPLWSILGRATVPWEFKALDYVAVAGVCGCILVRRKRWARQQACKAGKVGKLYECNMCNLSGRNGQEVELFRHVKHVLQSRAEQFVVCSQMPLAGKRYDVVVVPLHATAVDQLVVVELDGVDHKHKPMQFRRSCIDAFNATVASDNEKERLVRQMGMQFARLSITESAQERTARIAAVLDNTT